MAFSVSHDPSAPSRRSRWARIPFRDRFSFRPDGSQWRAAGMGGILRQQIRNAQGAAGGETAVGHSLAAGDRPSGRPPGTGSRTGWPEVITSRLEAARVELAAEPEFDITLVNTSVEEVCRQLVPLVTAPAGLRSEE